MIVSIIVAASTNNVIGKDNDLIWHMPNDMNFFKETTQARHVIMGRKNFESIPHKFRPLPNRTNIIVTRDVNYRAEDVLVVNSLEDGIDFAKSNNEIEAFVIGGGEIYKLALERNLIDKIYLTRIHHNFEGDTYFPDLSNLWKVTNRKDCYKDDRHAYDYSYLTLEKK
tara:strand:+ start:626 stop:1129 length:504 start_codon:yes stop_codon:yes gene_type:complete